MAKGKSANPADAFRKTERKKELKKNKNERQKARDLSLIKKDTTSIEEDIERLEKAEKDNVISAAQKTQLESLKTELARINKKKEEYVAEHPEHRRLVYRSNFRKGAPVEERESQPKNKQRNVFDENGLPRHPERSIYYDPVMNPYGVPPPGMPYMERPLRPDESDSQEEDDSEGNQGSSDDDIAMPAGPPPPKLCDKDNDDDNADDDDDDIPMPEGPPPNQMPPLPPGPPPLPPGPFSNYPPSGLPPMSLTAESFGSNFVPPFSPSFVPPPFPPSFPAYQMPPFVSPAFAPASRIQSAASMQDPLAPYPHRPYQSHRAERRQIHPLPNRPVKEITGSEPSSSAIEKIDAIISAPAELRDLKKESTAFMPASLKRKKAQSNAKNAKRINAAPEEIGGNNDVNNTQPRPDLLDTLRSNLQSSVAKISSNEST